MVKLKCADVSGSKMVQSQEIEFKSQLWNEGNCTYGLKEQFTPKLNVNIFKTLQVKTKYIEIDFFLVHLALFIKVEILCYQTCFDSRLIKFTLNFSLSEMSLDTPASSLEFRHQLYLHLHFIHRLPWAKANNHR